MASISVCLVTFNNESTIKESFNSILLQLNYEDEIIVIDLHSTDKTLLLIASFLDPRVKIIPFADSRSEAWNSALSLTKNEIIFLADPSTIWMSNKIEVYARELENCNLVFGNSSFLDGKTLFLQYKISPGSFNNLSGIGYFSGSIAFKSSLKFLILPIPTNIEIGRWAGNLASFFERVLFLKTCYTKILQNEIDIKLYKKPSSFKLFNMIIKRGRI